MERKKFAFQQIFFFFWEEPSNKFNHSKKEKKWKFNREIGNNDLDALKGKWWCDVGFTFHTNKERTHKEKKKTKQVNKKERKEGHAEIEREDDRDEAEKQERQGRKPATWETKR